MTELNLNDTIAVMSRVRNDRLDYIANELAESARPVFDPNDMELGWRMIAVLMASSASFRNCIGRENISRLEAVCGDIANQFRESYPPTTTSNFVNTLMANCKQSRTL